ncbi:TrkH family potassium uptake protein [Proteobacteria bacterium 005FR1]|nr:TrkH family potassium uptake protein [Proteobacteria bacterium 005FR1]
MSLFRPALTVLGLVLLIVALIMVLPLALALLDRTADRVPFLLSMLFTAGLGVACFVAGGRGIERITPRQMFMVTGLNWVVVSLVSALPFVLGSSQLSVVDAIFEAISGITTTGSTVIAGLDDLPRDILLWRSLMQWLGGLGIIGMAVAIFPYLKVGGMRLFQTESSDWTEVSAARVRQVAWNVVRSYLVISVLSMLVFAWLGMNWFDAVNHGMTAVATGGFSTYDASFGHFDSLPLLWAGSFFMLAGAIPFVLYFRMFQERGRPLIRDHQVRGMFVFLAVAIAVITLARTLLEGTGEFFDDFSHSVFNVVSIMTTTGFASEDYTLWGSAAVVVFFCLMFVGGCSGSTSGGIKVFRFQLLRLLSREYTIKSVHPVAAVKRHYNNRPVSESVLVSTIAYFFLVLASFAFFSAALAITGLDPVTSLTGAATALMNVGPGLGDIVGPAGNFSTLSDPAKLLLCAAMLLGRLEFVTLLVLFTTTYWRW